MTATEALPSTLDQIRSDLAAAGAEALVVSDPPSVRYLSGFTTPQDGVVVILPNQALLITDSRYTVQAEEESRIDVRIERPWLDAVPGVVRDHRLAIEADVMTVADHAKLRGLLGRDLVSTTNLVRRARGVKSPAELDHLREAARITDLAFASVLTFVRPGVREVDVAWHIRSVFHEYDAEPGFDIIVASGARSAMPHGLASGKTIEEGELVTVDMGARLHGYHADMTRTFAVGEPSAAARNLHAAVLEAEQRAVDRVAPGRTGDELDQLTRDILIERGYEDGITHSLGHGVGLQIHEGPNLRRGSSDVLVPGMVVTIEPGAYFPGLHGVRIEDLVVVTEDGHEVLSHSPRELEPAMVG